LLLMLLNVQAPARARSPIAAAASAAGSCKLPVLLRALALRFSLLLLLF
jgi:hypothetical protein